VNENKGAALLTGDIGCGKTLIARTLASRLDSSTCDISLITNPRFDEDDFIREVLYQFGLKPDTGRRIDLLHRFNDFLYDNARNNRRSVLIIDEAQLIRNEMVLEDIRLLLNFQLDDRFLLTLILIGQPELRDVIRMMPQLDQRISIRYHVDPLSEEDTQRFIAHRLAKAGMTRKVFTDDALGLIYISSGGIPRKINNVCDLSLVMGFARNLVDIDVPIIRELTRTQSTPEII
jgi:general secretion pathway protein A